MTNQFFSTPETLARLQSGALAPHIDSFAGLLSTRGYTKRTIQNQLRVIADLSHWLQEQVLCVSDLNEEQIMRFKEQATRSHKVIYRFQAVFPVLLEHLREIGAVPRSEPKPPTNALDLTVHEFTQYLVHHRSLAQPTISGYRRVIRDFLGERFGSGPVLLRELKVVDVQEFVFRYARTVGEHSARMAASALRNFLRSLKLQGDIETDLAAAVPRLATRSAKLPESLTPDQVQGLLASCDLTRPIGMRDYAILLLLARLGLRGGEVVAMRLSDFDWRAGELTVRGKGAHQDRLPILKDVGKALVTYLRHGRPQSTSPQVFLRHKVPYRGLAQVNSVGSIVCEALRRAGIDSKHKGPHLLRHTLASEMLRRGASLLQIAQVLRHRNTRTTEIYARVDLTGLRELAQPWPEDCP